jgi:ribosomal protein S8
LVKNAIQSIPEQQERKTVFVTVKDSNNVLIIVEDKSELSQKISAVFSNLNLLLKTAMGLGLGIIKTSLKIIKEQLPLKQNMEKEHGLLSLIIN